MTENTTIVASNRFPEIDVVGIFHRGTALFGPNWSLTLVKVKLGFDLVGKVKLNLAVGGA